MATKITQKGLEEKKAYLNYLKGEKTREIVQRIDIARGFGDLSENSEYDEARQAQTDNNQEIARIEELLADVEIIKGSTYQLKCLWNNKKVDYYVVGGSEADPFNNMISEDSPLGTALKGAKKGDKVTIHVPAGDRTYEVLKVILED